MRRQAGQALLLCLFDFFFAGEASHTNKSSSFCIGHSRRLSSLTEQSPSVPAATEASPPPPALQPAASITAERLSSLTKRSPSLHSSNDRCCHCYHRLSNLLHLTVTHAVESDAAVGVGGGAQLQTDHGISTCREASTASTNTASRHCRHRHCGGHQHRHWPSSLQHPSMPLALHLSLSLAIDSITFAGCRV